MQYKIRHIRLFLAYIICTFNLNSYANESTNFIHLKAEVNRQDITVTNVIEDSLGYLWFKASDQLLKFDGYEYQDYKQSKLFGEHSNSHEILDLAKDRSGSIWCVSTKGNISKLLASGKFSSKFQDLFQLEEHQSLTSMHMGKSHLWFGSNFGTVTGQSIVNSQTIHFTIQSSNESITSLSEGKNGELWFSTNKGRIFKGNIYTKQLTELKGSFNNPFSTLCLTTDHFGNLWIGTELHGLFYYNTEEKSYVHFHQKTKQKKYWIPGNLILTLFCDTNGMIWVGTDGGGLYQIDPKSKEIKIFQHVKANKFSLQSNSVIRIGETKNKDIWIFTNYGNINILPNESSRVGYYSGSLSGAPTRILSILRRKNGDLWLGTDGEGITLINKKGKATKQFIAKTPNAYGLSGNYIQAMVEDKNKNVWIGTYLNGLAFYDTKRAVFTPVKVIREAGQEATDIRSLFIDSKNRLWIGSNIGVFVFSLSGEKISWFPHNHRGLTGTIAEVFIEDENGQIWIGMEQGNFVLLNERTDFQNSTFQDFQLSKVNPKDNSIIQGTTDYQGNLYLINSNSKLIKFNSKEKKVEPITGFSSDEINNVMSVIVQDSSNLWLSKNSGISHLNLSTKNYYSYNWRNGIQKGEFLSGSATKDFNNIFYFGGVSGVNFLDARSMQTSPKNLRLRITNLKVVNRNAEDIIPKQLSSGIEHLSSLKLNHEQTSFSFQFSVINDHLSPNYYYTYRLKGFNDKWVVSENERIATYTNIPYGEYIFEVKAGSKKDAWEIQAQSVNITILPPFWHTWWAYSIYTLLLAIIVFFLIRYSIMWARLKKKLLLEEWQNEHNKELYAMKMNFFAKMSHEIQTPLTLILSPIQDMLERAQGNLLLQQRLQIIQNNANRLSRIALELMTVRNKEMGKLQLRATCNNLSKDITKISVSFMEQARFKEIDFSISGTETDIMLWYDNDKLEHVLYNLLTNAFKFTLREGQIRLMIENKSDNPYVLIKVSDTGTGISETDLQNIFDLFYQSPEGKMIGGTGIGLALTKELITLHKGKIDVVSEVGKGTTFTISLRKGKQHFHAEELFDRKQTYDRKEENFSSNYLSAKQKDEDTPVDSKKKNILIVEDNYEMLLFLKDTFKMNYNVRLAENGKEALDITNRFLPDIILSDVMMPVMDGITLCKTLNEKRKTRHIPIILLTTRNTTATKLEGLKYGAIEYISKPFNVKELVLKVSNILESQKRYIEQYRTELLTESTDLEVESPDEKFIESILVEIENNFADSDFRLEELATPLHMSYSNIYRKFQNLTGKTLVDFVRAFRLRKAASILEKHNFTIAEVAFRVGFNDPKYFSKCFKKEYGLTPKQFKLKNRQNSENKN